MSGNGETRQRRALLIGDAGVASGFARMNDAYVRGLQAAGWDVHVLGLNYLGDPHAFPYPIYPCMSYKGGDRFGLRRTVELVERLRPDVVCLTNDPWNVQEYLKKIGNTPTVASLAVDGKNCRGNELNGLAHAIFWTEFGLREARLGGYIGTASVIPLGVDIDMYKPMKRSDVRSRLRLPDPVRDAFIIGVVGRNQPRKRLDLTLLYFAEWIRSHDVRDAFLFLHVGPTGDAGYDLLQLGKYLQISNRMIVSEPAIGQGAPESSLAAMYSAFDIMLTTTQGEGWGLTTMEGMACGVPSIVPEWAALGEWPGDAALRVPCSGVACTLNGVNVVGGIADKDATINALDFLYRDKMNREAFSGRGLELVIRPEFRWQTIGARFAEAVQSALEPKKLLSFGTRAREEAAPL